MKKVGLLTFHQVANYGAVLQCYALRQMIEQEGYQCDIIPYSCNKLKENEKLIKFNGNVLVSLVKSFSQLYGNIKKRRTFDEFLKEYCGMNNIVQSVISWNYDEIVVGSDQVWNLKLTNYDFMYLLKEINCNKKISYAASLGEDFLTKEEVEQLVVHIHEFEFVSVRENSAKKLLNENGIKVDVVSDPVLVFGKNGWMNFIDEDVKIKKPYILIYVIEKSKTVFDYARFVAKELGADIVYLNQNLIKEYADFIYIRGASPRKFLNYIFHADFIVTNSFHGTSFSMIFGKKFAVDKEWHGKENVRVNELLNKLDLENRTIQSMKERGINAITEQMDWSKIEQRLNILAKNSRLYLHQSLE